MTRKLNPKVKRTQDFLCMSKTQKVKFFERCLLEDDKQKLARAVAYSVRTMKEKGGGLSYEADRLVPVFARNRFRENMFASVRGFNKLVKAAREGRDLKFAIDHLFEPLFHTMFGYKLMIDVVYEGTGKRSPHISMEDTWKLIFSLAKNMKMVKTFREDLVKMADNSSFTPMTNEQMIITNIRRIFGGGKIAEMPEPNEPMWNDNDYLLNFHTHPNADGPSNTDLGVVTDLKHPAIVVSPSHDFKSVDMYLVEPRKNRGAINRGVIYSYLSPVELPSTVRPQ
ncbi:MAG: hypothetical protein Q7S22_00095 [Candidatus Micrarchaeota archaeon]|nr:hypothetical protein [Candidatus Micrarchaeota archaeon]